MITRKDRQMGLTTMKPAQDVLNPKMGECPNRKALKGVCPNMTTRKDQEIDRVRRQVCKTSDDLKDGGMP